VLGTKDELGGTVPNSHNDLVATKEAALGQRLVPETRKTQVTDLDHSARRHKNVGRLEVTMKHKVGVQKVQATKKLVQQAAECRRWDGSADRLGVVMDDLLHVSLPSAALKLTRKSCSAYSNTM
jgi:hypothetical protein